MRRIILLSLFFAMPSMADDTPNIDAIIDAYYAVNPGPQGHVYDAQRDASIHAEGALITKFFLDGSFHRHDLATEQAMIVSPYEAPFFEFETGRRVERTENIAHVWSNFEVRSKPQGEVLDRGVNSISLFFRDQRWWRQHVDALRNVLALLDRQCRRLSCGCRADGKREEVWEGREDEDGKAEDEHRNGRADEPCERVSEQRNGRAG